MIDPKLDSSRQDLAEPLGEVSIPRLYAYHRALREARAAGAKTMTSHGLAGLLGHTITSTQIRKDLSALAPARPPRPGVCDRSACGAACLGLRIGA